MVIPDPIVLDPDRLDIDAARMPAAAISPRAGVRTAAFVGFAPVPLVALGLTLSLSRPRFADLVTGHELGNAAMALACGIVAAVILSRRPGHPVGQLFAVIGFLDSLGLASSSLVDVATKGTTPYTVGAWLSSWTWLPGLALTFAGVSLLTPDGLARRRWRRLWRIDIGLIVGACVCQAFSSHLPTGPHTSIVNPVAITGVNTAGDVVRVVAILSGVVSVGVLIGRVVRAEETLRRQLLPIVAAAAATLVSVSIAQLLGTAGVVIQDGCFLLLPAAVLLSVLRLRLYDLEIAIGRSATWVALSAGLVAVYVAVVQIMSSLLGAPGRTSSIIATVVIGLIVNPLRIRLQDRIAAWLYGNRGDPYQALSRTTQLLAGGADPVGALRQAAADLAHRLRSPGVRIVTDGRILIGTPNGIAAIAMPLMSGATEVGQLEVLPRAAGETFSHADERLILDLCAPLSNAVAAVGLTEELRASRERLALAREAERQRVRGELHDDVGPSLAAAALQTQLVRRRLDRQDLHGVESELTRLSDTIMRAANDLRSAIDSLGPRVLDEVGLADAVRSLALSDNVPPLTVAVGDLSPMPAAVETVAYRVIAEALTNARRHARASVVQIEVNQTERELSLCVGDDGIGGAISRPGGVGIASMRARVEELGGQFCIEPGVDGRGTSVIVRIPTQPVALAS